MMIKYFRFLKFINISCKSMYKKVFNYYFNEVIDNFIGSNISICNMQLIFE